jgi:hypothetical protein
MLKHIAKVTFLLLICSPLSSQAQEYYDDYRDQREYTPENDYKDHRDMRQRDQFDDYRPRRRYARPHQRQPYDRTVSNYFKASMGWSSVNDFQDASGELRFDDSLILPIHLGYGFTAGNAAFEAELGFSNNRFEFLPGQISSDYGIGDLTSGKLMFNGLYKTRATGSNVYIGGGVGLASVTMDGLEDELNGSSFAAQFILGAEIRTSRHSGLFFEYKHLETFGLEVENDFALVEYDFNESSFNIGVKLYF